MLSYFSSKKLEMLNFFLAAATLQLLYAQMYLHALVDLICELLNQLYALYNVLFSFLFCYPVLNCGRGFLVQFALYCL